MNAMVELSLFPVDQGVSLSPYVARSVAIIRQSGLPCRLGPMGTCIEGPFEEVMAVVNRCVADLSRDCQRVYLTIKADLRREAADSPGGRLEAKVASVEARLAALTPGQSGSVGPERP
jgi:uncharacterized protein (TIGR00106 family)